MFEFLCEVLKFLRGEPSTYRQEWLARRRQDKLVRLYQRPDFQILSGSGYLSKRAEETREQWEERCIAFAEQVGMLPIDNGAGGEYA